MKCKYEYEERGWYDYKRGELLGSLEIKDVYCSVWYKHLFCHFPNTYESKGVKDGGIGSYWLREGIR